MAEKQEIEIFVSDEGYVKYHIKGIKGSKCLEVGKVLGKVLGKTENIQLTSEYYEQSKKTKETTKQKLK